ncbi:MAG TPA: hypothetical protein PK559_07440 [Ignavibacteriaceae bacterium]|nr:hypothetical protein [Ignavibacteriaceae bacterium]
MSEVNLFLYEIIVTIVDDDGETSEKEIFIISDSFANAYKIFNLLKISSVIQIILTEKEQLN